MTTPRRDRASVNKLLRWLLLGLCAAAADATRAQDPIDSTAGSAPGPAQRSVTETGETPPELEPETTTRPSAPGTIAPGIKAGGTGLHWDRAPIRYRGNVGLLFTDTRPSGSASTMDTQLYTRLDGDTYLKAPWFATLEGGLGLSTALQKSADSRSSTVTATGDAGITMFPVSRFPFHAYGSVTDSRINQDLVGTSQYKSTTFGATQIYSPLNSRTNYSGSLYYNRLNGDRFGTDTQVSGNATMITATDQHLISVAGTASGDVRKDGNERSHIYNLTAKDEYHDGDALTLMNLGSASRSVFKISGSDTNSDFMQATSSGSWTPIEDVPLQLSGGAHFSQASTRNNNMRGSSIELDTKSMGASLGANYRWNKNLRLTGTTTAGINRVGGDESRTSRASTTASYSSDARTLGSYYYNYGLSGSATLSSMSHSGNSTQAAGQTSGSQRQTTENASHSLSKNERLDDAGMFTTRLTQGVSATQAAGQTASSILHSAAVTWSQATESRQYFAGLTVTDQRSRLMALDMFNAQFSASGDIGRYSTLSAAVTLQAAHQRMDSAASSTVANAGTTPETSTTRNASAEATYVNVRAFGVMRLKFSSILRADTFTRDARFTGTVGAPAEDIRLAWENRFDYTVGLLTLELLGRITQASGRTDGLLFASAQRKFGGLY